MKGIGTDILAIARMAAAIERTGRRMGQRILTPAELDRIDALNPRALSKAFAAKEAVVKALGTGFRGGIGWHNIEISRDELGRPQVTLSGPAVTRFATMGGRQVLLSLSDEKDYVVAFAVID